MSIRGAHSRAQARGTLLVAVLLAGLVVPRLAQAASTVCGTLITNVATATMTSGFPDFVGYEVSYNATCTVLVLCPPVVALKKYANGGMLTEAAAGATVTFQICIENQTTDTIWAISVTDRMPDNMTFVSAGGVPSFDQTAPNLGAPAVVNATTVAGLTAGTVGAPAFGTASPVYLRWTYPGIGPSKSACVVYQAKIL
jgi:uncharacterized repeat protein (TIGR01451 family)